MSIGFLLLCFRGNILHFFFIVISIFFPLRVVTIDLQFLLFFFPYVVVWLFSMLFYDFYAIAAPFLAFSLKLFCIYIGRKSFLSVSFKHFLARFFCSSHYRKTWARWLCSSYLCCYYWWKMFFFINQLILVLLLLRAFL